MTDATVSDATAERGTFGQLPDGRTIEAVTLVNGRGMRARLIAYGATLQALEVPDRAGRLADIVLGHADIGGYLDHRRYFGASVGRYANRIAGGRFALDGHRHALTRNDGPHTLHGGAEGFDRRLWTIADVRSGPVASVTFAYVSADGEEGFPGTLAVSAAYSLGADNTLTVAYRATTDRPTIVNLTHHSYFNLGGEASRRSVMDHRLTIAADAITPVDATLIPTGEFRPVAGTAFDFRTAAAIGAGIGADDPQIAHAGGYDHNWVIARAPSRDLRLAARLEDPATGRVMELFSNQPGLQFYSGNFLDGGAIGKSGHGYRRGDGLCLEPQLFPDTPNRPAFGSARLDPGDTYRNRIVHRFSTTDR